MQCNNSPLVLENPESSGLRNPFDLGYPHRQEMGLTSNIPSKHISWHVTARPQLKKLPTRPGRPRTLHRDPALLLRRRARARASRAELPCRCLCINFLCSVRLARNTEKAVFSTGYSVIMITTWPNPTLNFATK